MCKSRDTYYEGTAIKQENNATLYCGGTILLFFLILLVGGLVYAHCLLHRNIQTLIVLQDRYRACIQIIEDYTHEQKIGSNDTSAKQNELNNGGALSDLEEGCDNTSSFIPLNRTHNYLKESAVDFFKSQKLDDVLVHICPDDWQEYTSHLLTPPVTPVCQPSRRVPARPLPNKRVQPHKNFLTRSSLFKWPIDPACFWISSFFGPRVKRNGTMGFHYGIDMAALKGTVAKSAAAGVVVEAHHSHGYGNTVVIEHTPQFKTRYAHLDSICVRAGQKISAHMPIGRVGETGYIRKRSRDGSHLHFEVYDKGKRVNPLHYLPPF